MLSFLFALLNGNLSGEFHKQGDKHNDFRLFSHADITVLENSSGEKILELKMFASKEDPLNHSKPIGSSIRYIRVKDIVSVETFHAKNSTDTHLLVIYTKVKDLQYYIYLGYATYINRCSKKNIRCHVKMFSKISF